MSALREFIASLVLLIIIVHAIWWMLFGPAANDAFQTMQPTCIAPSMPLMTTKLGYYFFVPLGSLALGYLVYWSGFEFKRSDRMPEVD